LYWLTVSGASAAGTASWHVHTVCGFSIPSIGWRKNAPSATTASPKA
jgi:hypothetical protein